jgi:hypothetical protein
VREFTSNAHPRRSTNCLERVRRHTGIQRGCERAIDKAFEKDWR